MQERINKTNAEVNQPKDGSMSEVLKWMRRETDQQFAQMPEIDPQSLPSFFKK